MSGLEAKVFQSFLQPERRVLACAVVRRRFPVVQVPPGNRSSRKQPEQSWR
jgi:hypothetical protein